MLRTSADHYRRQQRITAAGLLAARRERSTPAKAAEIVAAFQILAARDALASVDAMLDEQGIDAPPEVNIYAASVAGVASDGRPLESLLERAGSDFAFGLMVATQLQDAARVAASMGIAVRDQIGYVRMLNAPSCSRCAILAGKWFKWNEGFQRHPKCDCRHVPARETNWHGLTTNPDDYFHSLPTAEQLTAQHPNLTVKMRQEAGLYSQEDIFTKAGARAIRDGADMGQIVNARRGMQRAQVLGREGFTTLEGTTRKGLAYLALGGDRERDRRAPGGRLFRTTRQRVMPETIYQLAPDRETAVRMLIANGFGTPAQSLARAPRRAL